ALGILIALGGDQIQVTKSLQSGDQGTFVGASQGLDLSQAIASFLPPLVVNPTKIRDANGAFFDELLFGTNKVFESDNSAANWDSVSGSLGTAALTALAFGPSGPDVFYAGNDIGQVFVDLHDGGDGFPNRSTGLPGTTTGGRINGIAVDPRDPKTAYVMTGGRQPDHVFKTTDGGLTWTSISATLPRVPAYAMAIDPRSSPASANGFLYVGTDVGVFVSSDNGATWARLGQGLPNVPVVDLQIDTVWEELVAATQGRG